jgi:TolB protein
VRLRYLCLLLAATVSCFGQTTFQGTLVFAANPSGNWELFQWQAGRPPLQLTKSNLDVRGPSLSADRSRVAYTTSEGALWVMDIATKTATKLANNFKNGHYGYPTWLNDGSALVYTIYNFNPPSEDGDIFIHSFKDGKQKVLVNQTGPQDYPAVSAAGDRLAYMSSLATLVPGFGATVTQQLWVVSLQTGKPQQLFYGSSRDTRPAWSPDGKQLAFSSDRSGTVEIWVADSEGKGAPQQITSGPGVKMAPTWSPDGTEIAYASTASGKAELMIVIVATKSIRRLQPFPRRQVEIRDPNWR